MPREEDVKFTRLCEGRGYPVLRIGVTDSEPALEVQGAFTASVGELATTFREPLRARSVGTSRVFRTAHGHPPCDGCSTSPAAPRCPDANPPARFRGAPAVA